jgi:hypothetical protein
MAKREDKGQAGELGVKWVMSFSLPLSAHLKPTVHAFDRYMT